MFPTILGPANAIVMLNVTPANEQQCCPQIMLQEPIAITTTNYSSTASEVWAWTSSQVVLNTLQHVNYKQAKKNRIAVSIFLYDSSL